MRHRVEAQLVDADTPADRLSMRIEELRSEYTIACKRAARTRNPEDNAEAEDLRQQIFQASKRFQVLTNTLNDLQQ